LEISKRTEKNKSLKIAKGVPCFEKGWGIHRNKIEATLKDELNELFRDKALIIENVLFSEVKVIESEAHRSGQSILSVTPAA